MRLIFADILKNKSNIFLIHEMAARQAVQQLELDNDEAYEALVDIIFTLLTSQKKNNTSTSVRACLQHSLDDFTSYVDGQKEIVNGFVSEDCCCDYFVLAAIANLPDQLIDRVTQQYNKLKH